MITEIRHYFKGTASKFLLWVILLGLAGVFSIPTFFGRGGFFKPWAIRVNGYYIDMQEYMVEVTEQKNRLMAFRAQYGQYADLFLQSMGLSSDPKVLAFDTLIKEKLLNQIAHKIGLIVHPDHISRQLTNPLFLQQEFADFFAFGVVNEKGTINKKALTTYVQKKGITIGQFEQKLEEAIKRNIVAQMVKETVFVPRFDSKQRYIAEHAKKKYAILTIPFAHFLSDAKKNAITDNELKTFFDKHNAQNKRYWVPEKRSGTQWTFDAHTYDIEISDKEIENYYEDNKLKYYLEEPTKIQVRRILFTIPSPDRNQEITQRAESIRAQLLENPDSFAQLAKEVSDDKESAARGGQLNFFSKGEKEKAFERAAFLLPADGSISEIIETKEGFEILQRISKKMPVFTSLEKVKNKIGDTLIAHKFKDLFVQDMKEILEESAINETSFAEFVKNKGGKPTELENITKDAGKKGHYLFTLQPKEFSFYIDQGKGIAIRLDAIHESYVPTFDSVKTIVSDDFYEELAHKKLTNEVKKIKDELAAQSLESLANRYKFSFEKTNWVNPEDPKELQPLQSKGISLMHIVQLEKEGMIVVSETSQDSYVAQLTEIEPIDLKNFAEDNKQLMQKAEQEREQMLLKGFVASLYRSATIESNKSLIFTQE